MANRRNSWHEDFHGDPARRQLAFEEFNEKAVGRRTASAPVLPLSLKPSLKRGGSNAWLPTSTQDGSLRGISEETSTKPRSVSLTHECIFTYSAESGAAVGVLQRPLYYPLASPL
eukprot:CAMPEP_0180253354 /NCGR_PEP_ID=MMETSP0987-20121128/39554_1 /TAXON_ID=697907 /ORGANISM="non described non described, Strain CCMP2293" /LENGTH=114 /DNA_ID=CAMNT_0022222213 /DNA_START=30 /DNA_END=370 /DNA_ORIENTATION=+